MKDASSFNSELRQFTGSQCLYGHPMFRKLKYTEGIQWFATNAGNGAYWLIDIIGSEPAIQKQGKEFCSIKMSVKEGKARIWANDGNLGPNVYERCIDYTDCPEGQYSFYLIEGTLLLATEY